MRPLSTAPRVVLAPLRAATRRPFSASIVVWLAQLVSSGAGSGAGVDVGLDQPAPRPPGQPIPTFRATAWASAQCRTISPADAGQAFAGPGPSPRNRSFLNL